MSLSSVGSVGIAACCCEETRPATKRRKLEDSQHEPLSPTASDPYREEEDQDSVTAQVGCPYNGGRLPPWRSLGPYNSVANPCSL